MDALYLLCRHILVTCKINVSCLMCILVSVDSLLSYRNIVTKSSSSSSPMNTLYNSFTDAHSGGPHAHAHLVNGCDSVTVEPGERYVFNVCYSLSIVLGSLLSRLIR